MASSPPALTDEFVAAWNSAAILSASTALVAGQFIQVGSILVPAGTVYVLGSGTHRAQESATGRIYMDLRDTTASPGAQIQGFVRWVLVDPQSRIRATIWEGRSEQLRTTLADRRQQLPFPILSKFGASWQWSLALQVNGDNGAIGNGTLSGTNTVALVSYTSYETKVSG